MTRLDVIRGRLNRDETAFPLHRRDVAWLVETVDLALKIVEHQRYRNHPVTAACSACEELLKLGVRLEEPDDP